MPTNLGTIGAYGAKGGQDELQQMLAERVKAALIAQQRQDTLAQQDIENKFKAQGLAQSAETARQAQLDREDATAERIRAARAGTLGATIDNAAPQQDLTSAVDLFKGQDNPQANTIIAGLKQSGTTASLPTMDLGRTDASGDHPGTGKVTGPGVRFLNPKLPPREPVKKLEPADFTRPGAKTFESGGYDSETNTFIDQSQKAVPNAVRYHPPTAAGNAATAPEVAPSVVKWTADQVTHDPTLSSQLIGNDPKLRAAVRDELASRGTSLDKLDASTIQMSQTAKDILPHIDDIRAEAAELDKAGLLGPIKGRWADFVANKLGAGDIAAGAEARTFGKFKTDMGLLMTAVARAHGGARGGGSPAMLEHMQNILDGYYKDFDTFQGNLDAAQSWMKTYAAHKDKGSEEQAAPGNSGGAPALTMPPLAQRVAGTTKWRFPGETVDRIWDGKTWK